MGLLCYLFYLEIVKQLQSCERSTKESLKDEQGWLWQCEDKSITKNFYNSACIERNGWTLTYLTGKVIVICDLWGRFNSQSGVKHNGVAASVYLERHHNRVPVAQLVEHRVVMREVESSTHSILRVLKELSRKCCLCNYVSKWLDCQVFSDKNYKREVPSHNPCRINNCGMLKNPQLFVKSRARSFRCCSLAFTGPQ